MRFSQTNKPPLGSQINWSHPLAKGVVACWLMNERSGNRISDLSGNGSSGILTNGPLWVPDGIFFDGTDDRIVVNSSIQAFLRTLPKSTLTIEFTPFDDHYGALFCFSETISSSHLWQVSQRLTGALWLGVSKAAGVDYNIDTYTPTSILVLGKRCIFSVITGVQGNAIFFNGVKQALSYTTGSETTFDTFSTVHESTCEVTIGSRQASGAFNYAHGTIHSIFIHNTALTQAQISALHASPYAMFEHRPYWMDYTPPAGTATLILLNAQNTLDGNCNLMTE